MNVCLYSWHLYWSLEKQCYYISSHCELFLNVFCFLKKIASAKNYFAYSLLIAANLQRLQCTIFLYSCMCCCCYYYHSICHTILVGLQCLDFIVNSANYAELHIKWLCQKIKTQNKCIWYAITAYYCSGY